MSRDPESYPPTLVETLHRRAGATPSRLAFEFELPDAGTRTMDYAELDRGARAVAARLRNCEAGSRVLLLYPPGPDYVTAFFGCLYARMVAVPAYYPTGSRGLDRIEAIAADSGAELALTDTATLAAVERGPERDSVWRALRWTATDDLDPTAATTWRDRLPTSDDLAFLQYTSGSTGTPKGVMVSHGNLAHNSATIARALDLDETSRCVSWLPPYHDMGLIGGILQPVHSGFPCTLLTPLTFLRRPLRWLEALTRTRATATVAPDFAYAEAVHRTTVEERELVDLSALRHALVGSEPVRASTIDDFAKSFQAAGFRRTAFYPCYGLAEATLFVTGGARTGNGPVSLPVVRSELDAGRVVVAEAGQGPAAVLTGCGRAHGSDLVLVVDPDSGTPLPQDVVGEILVSGPTVAPGYWRQPDATQATFRATVDGHPGRTFLRTGDLGFWHGEELFIAGRVKDLIVVRGRNHHPQDLEQTVEAAHPLLQPFRGAAFAVDDGSAERVVHVHEVRGEIRADDGPAVVNAVRETVTAKHELFLDEVVLCRLGSIPRTSSGKVRRAECRERWRAGGLNVVYTTESQADAETSGSVHTEVPEALASLVATALGTSPGAIATDTPLVAQGLDSLRAVRLSVAVEESGGAHVPIARLLDGMTLHQLATLRTGSAETPMARPDSPVPTTATSAQERMWLLDRMGAGAAYHIAGGLHLTGPLDADLLAECMAGVLAEFPSLHSVFTSDEAGEALRVSLRPSALPLPVVDLMGSPDVQERAWDALRELAGTPFDLQSGPLLRLLLLKLAPTRWCLGLAAHHIVLDGWSLGILLRRLGDAYRRGATGSRTPAPQPIPAQPLPITGDKHAVATAFWREHLAGAHPVDLPTDRPHRPTPTWRGKSLPVELPAELAERVRALAADRGTTPFTVLLAAFGVLLAHWADQDDLVVGTVISGRDRRGVSSVVGLLADILPVRVDLGATPGSPIPDFASLVDQVHTRCLDGYRHSELPFDAIVRATGHRADGSRAPLVRTLFVLQNLPVESWEAGGVRADPFELPAPGAQFELSVHLTPHPDGSLTGHAVYAADLFDADTIASLLAGLPVLLNAASQNPDTLVTDLPLLPGEAADRIARSCSDGGPPTLGDGLVHELITAAADAHPDVTAVAWDSGEITYRALSARIDEVAGRLRAMGVVPDQPVAICLDRSPELVIAVCAVLAAGGAYLPLDPSHPPTRLGRQVRVTGARILVSSRERAQPILDTITSKPRVLVLGEPDHPLQEAGHRPVIRPQHLVNILHTSGTTGTPKAVMTTHAALANRLMWMQDTYRLQPGEAVLHKTPVSFDVAGWELLWPLTVGATVVLARPQGHRDPRYLADLILRHRVTTCHFVPSMLFAFLAEPAAASCARVVRRLVCSGEELTPALAEQCRRTLPGVQLHNLYGPAEAAIDVTAQPVTDAQIGRTRIPIGRPIAGARLYVLDRSGRIAPPLAPGELHIGGLTPARGYLGLPGLTAERFVPDPFHSGDRLYRTGDRARLLPDGTLEYLGRSDRQLKIRGQRVEPGEVEAALNRHPLVAAAIVEPYPDPDGELRLAAWVVPTDTPPTLAQLRGFLLDHLPSAMVPEVMYLLAELPVGPHGKLDRAALPDPGFGDGRLQPEHGHRIAPRNPVEGTLASIWSEVVGCHEPSVTDDFYELGGHSLLATRVAVRVRAVFGVDIPMPDLLDDRLTIERLAALVQSRQLADPGNPEVGEVLHWMSGLSDEQVTALLADNSPGSPG